MRIACQHTKQNLVVNHFGPTSKAFKIKLSINRTVRMHCVSTSSFSNGTPAAITISSPDCTRFFNCVQQFQTCHQLMMELCQHYPKFKHQSTFINSSNVNAKISAFGRYLENQTCCVTSLSKSYNQFDVR